MALLLLGLVATIGWAFGLSQLRRARRVAREFAAYSERVSSALAEPAPAPRLVDGTEHDEELWQGFWANYSAKSTDSGRINVVGQWVHRIRFNADEWDLILARVELKSTRETLLKLKERKV